MTPQEINLIDLNDIESPINHIGSSTKNENFKFRKDIEIPPIINFQ